MITQTKTLKDLLKKHGITDSRGLPLRVRTKKNRYGEWGRARAHTRKLTNAEIEALKKDNQCVEVFQHIWVSHIDGREMNCTIVTY